MKTNPPIKRLIFANVLQRIANSLKIKNHEQKQAKKEGSLGKCGALIAFVLAFSSSVVWAQVSITSLGTPFTENFDGLGTSATATLPAGFKIGTDWASGTTATTLAYGSSGVGIVTGSSSGGTINWANGATASATDRSLGFLNTGSFTSPKSIVYAFVNNSGSTITSLTITFDYEQTRSGTRQFDWTFSHGSSSAPSVSATSGDQSYAAELNNTTIFNPPTTTSKSVTLTGLSIAPGATYYLRWTFTGLAGSTNGKGVGIDNFSITASGCTTPALQTVTGGGNYCSSGSGVPVGLANSETGVNYQLFVAGTTPVGSFVPGTGGAISFGNQTVAGTYTVIATNTTGGCTADMTGNAVVTVTLSVTPSVTVSANPGTTTCANNQVIFTAAPVNGGGSPTYIWKTNSVQDTSVPANSATYTNSSLVDGETIDCQLTSSLTCVTAATADAPQLTMTITTSVTPAVSVVVSPGTTICAGHTVIFTATPVNGGPTPSYTWITNGVPDTSVPNSSATYTNSTLASGDTIDCQLLSNDPCVTTATANAAQLTMIVNANLTPSVSVSANPGSTICSNSTVTFTATPVNGGASPAYQWRTNGISVTGATSSIFATTLLKNGDVVTVVMTPSSDICVSPASATSSDLTMTVNPNATPSVTVTASPSSTICVGGSITFTATPVNGGVIPAYQWRINGVPVTGETSSTFTSSTLANGDIVTVVLTPSSDICVAPATATSANLAITINSFHVVTATALSENMGTTASGNPLVTAFTGWQSTAPIAFGSSTTLKPDVRTTTASSGYSGASGGDNVFFSATTGPRELVISGINTIGLNSLQLQFGLKADAIVSGDPFVVEISTDGVSYSPLTIAQPTSTLGWNLITASGSIPATSNLRIRFSKNTTSSWRVDDVKLQSVATSASITASGPITICADGSVTLTATVGGASYIWSTGATTPSIAVNSSGTYTVTIFDANGCSSTASQTVTVNPLPTVTVNSAAICAGGSALLTATTTANNPSYLWSPGGATTASITVAPGVTTSYTVTVADGTTGCINSGSGTVTVNPLPVVAIVPATTNVECGSTFAFTADASGDGPLVYQWYDAQTNAIAGETNVTLSVTNVHSGVAGNYTVVVTGPTCSASAVATLVVGDTLAPVITVLGANPATNECHVAYADAGATALDGCVGSVAVSTNDPVNADVPGVYTVTYTSDDGAGNTNSVTRTVYVVDTQAPTVVLVGANPFIVECHGLFADPGATASDACAGSVAVTTSGSLNVNIPGSYTLTYTADDGNGNTNSITRTVSVVDTIAPALTVLGVNPATNECHVAYVDSGATALDGCAGSVAVTTNSIVNANAPGVYTVTYTTDDGNGNTNSTTRTVYVVDTLAPLVSVLGANPYTNFAYVTFVDPGATATDACDALATVTTNGTVDITTPGTYVLEYIGADAAGNTATNTRTVEVIALIAPTITSEQFQGTAFEVTFTGPTGQPYRLLTSTDVTLPPASWTVLTTGAFGGSPVTYSDTTATNDAVRFYRVGSP